MEQPENVFPRSLDNSMQGVIKACIGKVDMIEDEWRLEKDVFLRIRKLNGFVSERTPVIVDEMAKEVWRAVFDATDVSFATEGIRGDLKRNTVTLEDGNTRITHFLQPVEGKEGSYLEFKEWINALSGGDACFETNYFAKFHHCRWLENDVNPKLNCISVSDDTSKTSFMLHLISRTCPSGVINSLGHQFPSNAFNMDRTLDDMLVLAEEAPTYVTGQVLEKRDREASNVLKSRLTTGVIRVVHFFIDEEKGNRRDAKYAQTSAQGSYLMATTSTLGNADRHLLSRFITIRAPERSLARKEVTDLQLAQHRDLHRIYFITEMMVKAKVIQVDTSAAEMLVNDILRESGSNLTKTFGLSSRAMNQIIEMARCICIANTIWRVMMSPEFQHLQQKSGQYIGLNVDVLTKGVFPLLVVNKQMVFHAFILLQYGV